MAERAQRTWELLCNDCGKMFDYFGTVMTTSAIPCGQCGKSSYYRTQDFIKHNPLKKPGEA